MFEKKTETKEETITIPVDKVRKKTSSGGKWILNEKDELVFRNVINTKVFDEVLRTWVEQKETIEDLTPKDRHWLKTIQDSIIIKKIVPSRTQIDCKDTLFFMRTLQYRIREELRYHYLHKEENSRKIYLKDFKTSVCFECPKSNSTYVTVQVVEDKPITKDEILKLYEKGVIGAVYDDVKQIGDETVYQKTVYAKN
ncbi:MAG: hypothetical protein JW702_08955 [Clostridiales bacterium]|nr:hypothetical protein [Clostridiales bacterium]